MLRLARWFAIVLGGFVGLFLVAFAALYVIGLGRLGATVPNLAIETVTIPTDSAAINRGEHVATIWGCRNCHGADLGGQAGNPLLSGTTLLGSVSAPNLTPGRGGIGGAYTDTDWVRAIRQGVRSDGRGAVLMYSAWALSDADLGDVIAYLKQLPAVDREESPARVGPLYVAVVGAGLISPAASTIDLDAPRPVAPAAALSPVYGRYVSTMCLSCHSERMYRSIAELSQDEFSNAMRSGVMPDGERFSPAMTTPNFAALTDLELEAIWLYAQEAQAAADR